MVHNQPKNHDLGKRFAIRHAAATFMLDDPVAVYILSYWYNDQVVVFLEVTHETGDRLPESIRSMVCYLS